MPNYLTGVRPYFLLILLCLAFFVPGQSAMPPTDRDEARFAQAARQMVQTGDLIDIRFQDRPRHKKPAGIYWLQAASVTLFASPDGNAIWPYRLPSVLGAIAAVLLTFATGALLFDRRTGFLAGALLGSSILLVIEAHIAKTDAVLLATVMAAIYPLARIYTAAREGAETGWAPAIVFWLAIGASTMIKGPIGPVIVGLTLATLLIADYRAGRATRLFRRLKPLPGLALVAIIVGPWLYAISSATGGAFVGNAVSGDLLPKLVSGQEAHGFPPGYFLFLMTATFWPGSLFVWHGLRWAIEHRATAPVLFLIAWIVPSWILFEIVPTKLPHYILPLYPALALLAARAAFAVEEGLVPWIRRWESRFAMAWCGILALALGLSIVALPMSLGVGFDGTTLIPLIATMVIAVWVMRLAFQARILPALSIAIVGAWFVQAPVFSSILPDIDALWPSRSAHALVAKVNPDPSGPLPRVGAAGYHEPSLVFMLGRHTLLNAPEEIAGKMRHDPKFMALIGADQEKRFRATLGADARRLKPVGRVRGFNYVKGTRVDLTLYRGLGKAAR